MSEYIMNRISLVPFVAIWGVYFLFLASAGYTANHSGLTEAVMYQVMFVISVSAPVMLLPAPPHPEVSSPSKFDRAVFAVALSLGMAAFLFLVADRLFIQGIDYSNGACIARGQMTRLGLERHGVSSPLSVFGQLFGYTYFVASTLVVTRSVSRKTFWLVMGLAFFILMLQAQVAASRSPLILFASFTFAGLCIRIVEGGIPRIKPIDVVLTVLFGLIAVGFVLSIFSCRAAASNQTTSEYAQGFTEFLGAKEATGTASVGDAVETQKDQLPAWRQTYVGGLFSITALYLVHSAYTFAGLISLPPDTRTLTLDGPIYLLQRVGLKVSNGEANEALSGRFPSLPGTLYHDVGVAGMILGGLVLGLSIWGALHLVSRLQANVVTIGIACAVLSVAYTSPLLLATNMMSFPFICFGFTVVPIIAYFATRGKWRKR